MGEQSCIIVDIDGTVADLTHRLHYISDGRKDYGAFFGTVLDDTPIDEVIAVVHTLRDRFGKEAIVFVSGRSDVCRQDTIKWLDHHVGPYGALYMRESGDTRKDTILKEDILTQLESDGYNPWLAIDDREDIAKMWRKNGIKTFLCSGWQGNIKRIRTPTLHVMVGPSGGGKPHYAEKSFPASWIVSSDQIREDLLHNSLDQSRNGAVFKAFHEVIKARLASGLDTVADATNLRGKDRLAVVELANGGPVVYYVVDRPMVVKVAQGGWRNSVEGLMQKHQQRFKSQLKDILGGDSMPNVAVENLTEN